MIVIYLKDKKKSIKNYILHLVWWYKQVTAFFKQQYVDESEYSEMVHQFNIQYW